MNDDRNAQIYYNVDQPSFDVPDRPDYDKYQKEIDFGEMEDNAFEQAAQEITDEELNHED